MVSRSPEQLPPRLFPSIVGAVRPGSAFVLIGVAATLLASVHCGVGPSGSSGTGGMVSIGSGGGGGTGGVNATVETPAPAASGRAAASPDGVAAEALAERRPPGGRPAPAALQRPARAARSPSPRNARAGPTPRRFTSPSTSRIDRWGPAAVRGHVQVLVRARRDDRAASAGHRLRGCFKAAPESPPSSSQCRRVIVTNGISVGFAAGAPTLTMDEDSGQIQLRPPGAATPTGSIPIRRWTTGTARVGLTPRLVSPIVALTGYINGVLAWGSEPQ